MSNGVNEGKTKESHKIKKVTYEAYYLHSSDSSARKLGEYRTLTQAREALKVEREALQVSKNKPDQFLVDRNGFTAIWTPKTIDP